MRFDCKTCGEMIELRESLDFSGTDFVTVVCAECGKADEYSLVRLRA